MSSIVLDILRFSLVVVVCPGGTRLLEQGILLHNYWLYFEVVNNQQGMDTGSFVQEQQGPDELDKVFVVLEVSKPVVEDVVGGNGEGIVVDTVEV